MTARDVQRAGHLSRLTNEVRIWAASSSIDCVTEHDAEYDARRFVYNRMHDLRPLAVLSPRSREQVALSLRYAGQLDVPVAVRGGGHHIAGFGTCQDGLVIDLRHFNDVDISSSGPEVTVGGGARLRDVDASLCRRGLVVPTGTVSDTGIGGLTLGGGIGWLIGCFGLTCDNLIGADVILANGTHIQASADHQDVLWALRGGGGSFGVVTHFRFRAHRLPRCCAGSARVPLSAAAHALTRVLAFLNDECPPELTVAPLLFRGPDGIPLLSIDFCLANDHDDSAVERLLKAIGPARLDLRRRADFAAWQQNTDPLFLEPLRGYWKGSYRSQLTGADAEDLIAAMETAPTSSSSILIEHLHGAFCRTGTDTSAFPLRWAKFGVLLSARWQDPRHDRRCVEWVRRTVGRLDPRGESGSYSNYSSSDEHRVLRDFNRIPEVRERLLRTKAAHDPRNLFQRNHLGAECARRA